MDIVSPSSPRLVRGRVEPQDRDCPHHSRTVVSVVLIIGHMEGDDVIKIGGEMKPHVLALHQ